MDYVEFCFIAYVFSTYYLFYVLIHKSLKYVSCVVCVFVLKSML